MITLYVFSVPGSLELSRRDLLARGVPEGALLDRTLRDALRCSISGEPGWSARGPAANMALEKDGRPMGTISITGAEWEVAWDHLACRGAGIDAGELEDLVRYWRDGVDYYRDTIQGPDVRRVLDRMLADLPESHPTLLGGLRWVPVALKPAIYRIHDLLPEVLFWAQDALEAPPGPAVESAP